MTAVSFEALVGQHVEWLGAARYAGTTIRSRRRDLARFASWCVAQGHAHPKTLTLPMLERYRLVLHQLRKRNGEPLGWGSFTHQLLAVKLFLRWAARMRAIAGDLGASIELPRRPHSLPRCILSLAEVERVLSVPDTSDARGLRDRAILETFYSTGMRRLELIGLKGADVSADRGLVFVRGGKGGKDRVIPIGDRALEWIRRYAGEVRPRWLRSPDPGNLFLTRRGRPLRPNRLSELAHRYVRASGVGQTGSCHMFRHTMATLMLDHGADVRYIQEMLGHAQLTTTEIYTRVSIARLKEVHRSTHPGNRLQGAVTGP